MVSFLGQMFNFIIFFLQKGRDASLEPVHNNGSKGMMILRLMLPAFFHLLTQMCGFAAYKNINASLAMMIGSVLPLATALLSRLFLGTKITSR